MYQLVFWLEEVISNTKAYQSPLDVPPLPKILTTGIKTKLIPTQGMPHTHQMYPPHRREVAESRVGSIATTRGQ